MMMRHHPCMRRYTYLNKQGRTVVVLRASNVVDALTQPFAVRYRRRPLAWAREPSLWGASIAGLLVAAVIFTQADFSLVRRAASCSQAADECHAVHCLVVTCNFYESIILGQRPLARTWEPPPWVAAGLLTAAVLLI